MRRRDFLKRLLTIPAALTLFPLLSWDRGDADQSVVSSQDRWDRGDADPIADIRAARRAMSQQTGYWLPMPPMHVNCRCTEVFIVGN